MFIRFFVELNSISVPYNEWLHHREAVLKRVDDDLKFPENIDTFFEFNSWEDAMRCFERTKNEYCLSYLLRGTMTYIRFEGVVLKEHIYDEDGVIQNCLILDFYRDDYKEY